jgi:Putative phage tail protein
LEGSLMGFLRQGGGNQSANNWIPFYTGLQIQTSSQGVPIQIIYGVNRSSPNLIWTGGYFAIAQYSNSGGGKGGGQQLTGYNYYASLALGLCEGPVYGIRRCYVGQMVYWYLWGTYLGFFANGSTPQAPWPYLVEDFGVQAISYPGVAYLGGIAVPLGTTPNIPLYSLEVIGRLYSSAVLNGNDADPALIIQDFLTNSQYGVGFPAGSIDASTLLGSSGSSSYQTYCQAAYLAMSPILSNQESASSILTRWLKLTNTAAVWSGGQLKFIPYGDQSITGALANGSTVTFNPNVTPVYNLTDDDLIHEDGKDPIECTRVDPYSLYNWQRITIQNRDMFYDSIPIDVWDQNAIELYGLRMAGEISANEICDWRVAQVAAQLILQRQLYIRNHYKFKLSWEYCLLEPMDLVTLTDPALGLYQAAVRITEIEEDESGVLAVTAEEFPGGIATAANYSVQIGSSNATNLAIPPARVNPPITFEPPPSLTGNIAQVWIAVSGGIAPVYHLAEDGSTGQHLTNQTLVSSQTSGTEIVFTAYVQAAERSACRLNLYNGSSTIGCDFNLSTGRAGTPDSGIDAADIASVGNGWYLCTIQGVMAATGAPAVSLLVEKTFGMPSYAGTSGDGIYIWGLSFSTGAENQTLLPTFSATTGATLATTGAVTSPDGTAGTADPNWGGCNVWISTDGSTYGNVGQVTAPARMGVLTAILPAPSGGNPDTTDTLSVSLVESGGQLSSANDLDAQNGVTLCLINDSTPELLSYATATLTGTNTYNLTYLYRGLDGTSGVAHASGAPFVHLTDAIFKYSLPAAYIGVLMYLKFQSFNIFGQAVEDLSECQVYTYTPSGAGSPLGPVSQALALGQSLDYQLASQAVSESDDWGSLTDAVIGIIDLGNITS